MSCRTYHNGQRGRLEANLIRVFAVAGLAVVVVPAAGEARASSSLTITADNDLVSIKARYDALDSSAITFRAGTLTGRIDGGAKFDAYCVDLYHEVKVGGSGSTFLVNPLPIETLGPPGGHGAGVGFLYDKFDPQIAAESSGTNKTLDGAALQVAIWKVEYDNGGPLNKGHFTLQDSSDKSSVQHQVFARATAFLSFYDGSQTGDATWFKALEHPTVDCISYNQNMVGPPTDPPIPTPEPATFVTSGLGALGLALFGWRRRQSGAARAADA
jgi:hypothetical protein